ncbi:hypothetical protein BDR04DRAFT_1228565 [Suillus decipiens]|nr:hypothetical protein BDR04DRAFT_1228565 [Suillus decipiens]
MHLVRFFTYIASCLSVARAFSVTVGTPTQCDPLTISWTGGQEPYEILLTPYMEMYQNFSVPTSAFSNGKGSYSISQLLLSATTRFLLTMSDATGFGSGGTTDILTVGNPIENNDCNLAITTETPSYEFYLSPSPTPPGYSMPQCSNFVLTAPDAVAPITVVQLIPGGQPAMMNSVDTSYTLVPDVNVGTTLMYFVNDSVGVQGGVSGFYKVSGSSDSSCLIPNVPSSTIGMSATATATTTLTSSTSSITASPPSSSNKNVALIAGAAGGGGGGAVFIALVILGMCLWRKRRASRSPNVSSSTKIHSGQLQRTNTKYAPPSSSNQTQRSRQSSNTDSPDTRSSTMSSSAYSRMTALSQPISLNYPTQYPVSYPRPSRSSSQSPLLDASTGNSTVSDRPTSLSQTLHSRQSSNADFAAYEDAGSSAMSSADRRMSTVAEMPSPLETNPVGYLGPPIQSKFQPSPIDASADNVAVNNPPTSFNKIRDVRQSSDTDTRSQSMAPASTQTTTAAGQTVYQPPTRIIVHTDADVVMPDDNGLVELPPQYSEHWGSRAFQSESAS